ncbi:hypothetical protein ACVWYH_006486 [Bradyrhizobium sp. GM24.11]
MRGHNQPRDARAGDKWQHQSPLQPGWIPMPATRRQVLAGAASVVCLTGDLYATSSRADTPANVVQTTESEIAVSIDNATVGSEDRVARIPVALSVPTNRTIALEYFARDRANESNRSGPQASTSQTIARGYLIFQPGEQQKTIEVPLPRPLSARTIA